MTKSILRTLTLVSTVLVCLAHASPAAAAMNLTITIPGLSCGAGFEALSFSWGASQSTSTTSSGSTDLKPAAQISDLNILKGLDGCSPALFGAVVKGSKFSTLTLTGTKAGVGDTVFTLTLTNVTVDSLAESGSEGGDDRPTESVSFGYSKVCINVPSSGSTLCYDKATRMTF